MMSHFESVLANYLVPNTDRFMGHLGFRDAFKT
jgi:hypothetical protein